MARIEERRHGLRGGFRNRVLLALCLLVITPVGRTQDAQDSSQVLSRDFVLSATGALARLHSVKQNMVEVNSSRMPGVEYNKDLAVQAYEKIREAQVNAKSSGDQSTADMLTSYAKRLQGWGEQYRSARESMDASKTMGEDEVRNDPDLQTMDECERGLAAALKRGSYTEEIRSCR
jgi:hypothetical protein